MSTTPLIYSELLSNIRQISVITALDTPCNVSTRVELSPDGQQFVLNHEGETTILNLPGQVAPQAQLQKSVIGSKELSWRLPLASQLSRSSDDSLSNGALWSAASLNEDAQFSCRGCGNMVLKRGAVKAWKDLPSENWAEMMDFWHCHKPDIPHTHASNEHPQPDKGYGPSSRFAAAPGAGFIDLSTLLLSEQDCVGTQPTTFPPQSQDTPTSPNSPPIYQPITCSFCTQYLGYHDPQNSGTRLYKWRLTLSLSTPSTLTTIPPPPATPSLSSILSAQLLSIVHSQCVSRILVLPHASESSQTKQEIGEETQTQALSLWIFAPTLRFSSSLFSPTACSLPSPPLFPTTTSSTASVSPSPPTSTLATKIFHRHLSLSVALTLLQSTTSSTASLEELYLPSEAIAEISEVLRKSSSILPPSARKFQVWDVGLLERWEG